jgi:hypothetical protein
MIPTDQSDPVLLIKWHDTANWLLDRIDGFPKNQRFIFGTRLADRTLGILELLVEATYAPKAQKKILLEQVNRDLAVLRWLVRMAKERKLLSVRQYGYTCEHLAECGRMTGGWLKSVGGTGSVPS